MLIKQPFPMAWVADVVSRWRLLRGQTVVTNMYQFPHWVTFPAATWTSHVVFRPKTVELQDGKAHIKSEAEASARFYH